MKLFFPFLFWFFTLIQFNRVQAQYVTIPDPNFLAWLQTHGYSSCLNGSQLDTTCSTVTGAQYVNCSNANISDLSGIKYFDNLKTLQCHWNDLQALPVLPFGLKKLRCNLNQLVALPELPSGLTFLDCGYNYALSEIPALPSTLNAFICENCNLSSLPELPLNLDSLNCRYNDIDSLPTLPLDLTYLDCDLNNLVWLPDIPTSCYSLNCSYNQLTTLPTLPDGLYQLYCRSNQLTSLPSIPTSLYSLLCSDNQLTSLPGLPSIFRLWCDHNILTSLPSLPQVIDLYCDYNQLSELPSFNTFLNTLSCSHNQLTSIPSFTSSYVDQFKANDNPSLTCMPVMDYFSGDAADFSIENTGITCLPNYVPHVGYIPSLDTLPLCGPGNPSGCAFIASCNAPLSSVNTSDVSSTSATTTWWTNSAAVKYRVRIKNMATGQTLLYFVNAPDTTKTFTGLAPNTLYKVQVRSQCSSNGSVISPWSAPVYFTTLPGTAASCDPPQNFSPFLFSNTSASIGWTIVSGANGYQLRYRPVGTTTWTPIVINSGTAGGLVLNGLTPNTNYQYQVRTKCEVNPTVWSNYSGLYYFSTPLRVGENENQIDVQLFPNPSNGSVTFNSNGLVGTLDIFDAVGKTIFHQVVSTSQTTLTDLPNGFLTYRFLTTDGSTFNGKIVVAK